MSNGILAAAYEDINPSKAFRLQNCATRLIFDIRDDGGKRLHLANFCRVRLCPMCTWRRALKVGAQMRRIMDAISVGDKKVAYLMLTLTVKNCEHDGLRDTLDQLSEGFKRLTKTADYNHDVLGYYRATEITHNVEEGTFHPHIHAVLAVRPNYFSKGYIPQKRWRELWKQALGIDYLPGVHVQKIYGETTAAVAEVAKYAMKSGDYIIPDDWDLTIATVRFLDEVLANRRFVGFGGIFREYHKKLNLDDAESGDLVHVDGEQEPGSWKEKRVCYAWFSGYRQYRRVQE